MSLPCPEEISLSRYQAAVLTRLKKRSLRCTSGKANILYLPHRKVISPRATGSIYQRLYLLREANVARETFIFLALVFT
jgi:hypothetical protein